MKYAIIILFIVSLSGCNYAKEEKAPVKTDAPVHITKQEVKTAEASTPLIDKTDNRINNIKLAAKAIDGYLLPQGETFSFNNVVGKRTEEKGYKMASVLLHKEKTEDFGGGVCQVSTTLFQAAKEAGLEIIERHSHEKEIAYAKQGEDAAVDYNSLDLKFKNNTENEVTIFVNANEDNVYVKLQY
ncbi:MAG: VanW family protein [Clostridia bacterium]|nr:VanW family protein [Clostridia bacterium]MBR6647352.1 VanW family protein [Clostridia bacterium]